MEPFSVVVPTYNERENIELLLARLSASCEPLPVAYEIIVVDDDSPDRTWEKAESLSTEYPVQSIRRTTDPGLSRAVLAGIEQADHDIVVVMDADLQHPPERVPDLVEQLNSGCDLVVASRYASGGSFGDFGLGRRLLSRLGDTLARILLREAREVKDVMSGFFVLRKEVVDGADLDPAGFKILLEILINGDYKEVSEVGYRFGTRGAGESKLGFENSLNYLLHLGKLCWRKGAFGKLLRFSIVGGLGAVANLLVLYLLKNLGIYYLLAGAAGIEVGLLSNFWLNKLWTYREVEISGFGGLLTALARDHLVRSVGMGINLFALWFFTEIVGLYYLLSQLLGIGLGTFWNFTGNQWWTWDVD